MRLKSRPTGLDFNKTYRKEIDTGKIRRVFRWIVRIVVLCAIAFALVFLWGYRVEISGSSMQGTLEEGDQVLVDRLLSQLFVPSAGDIIVFKTGGSTGRYSVKRVIAGPNDVVQVVDGYLNVNGRRYRRDDKEIEIDNPGIAEEEVAVGENEYFVLGDNPSSGEDSRFSNIGNVSREQIIGKPWLIIQPFSRFGRVRHGEAQG